MVYDRTTTPCERIVPSLIEGRLKESFLAIDEA